MLLRRDRSRPAGRGEREHEQGGSGGATAARVAHGRALLPGVEGTDTRLSRCWGSRRAILLVGLAQSIGGPTETRTELRPRIRRPTPMAAPRTPVDATRKPTAVG